MIKSFNQLNPIAYASKEKLIFEDTIPVLELKALIEKFFSELIDDLLLGGCKLIGHIKGLLISQDKGHLMFSITSLKEGLRFKGEMKEGINSAVLTINIIVYGIEQNVIESMFQKVFRKNFE